MPELDISLLRSHVEHAFGPELGSRFNRSIESVLVRFEHVAYHIDELSRLLRESVSDRTGLDLFIEVLRQRPRRLLNIRAKAEAHAIAAVLALHSIANLVGTMIILSLRGIADWKKYLKDVSQKLEALESELSDLINKLRDSDEYRYLDALAN